MKKLLSSMVAILALGAFANAGGGKLIEPPQVPPMAIDIWSGPYIGLQAGYIKGDGDVSITSYYSPVPSVLEMPTKYDTATLEPDGFIGGIYVGFNKKFNNDFLIGIEAAANYTKIDDVQTIKSSSEPVGKFKLEQKHDFALYLRAGKVMDNKVLPYVLAGVAWTKLEGTYTPTGGDALTDSDNVMGWTAGAGLEYKINRNWNVRLQYRYTDYKDADLTMQNDMDVYKVKVKDYNTHSVMAGVSYHF